MLADKMARQWAGIERAMNFANHNPAFRPQAELLVNTYFALIDEMAAELERRRVTIRIRRGDCDSLFRVTVFLNQWAAPQRTVTGQARPME